MLPDSGGRIRFQCDLSFEELRTISFHAESWIRGLWHSEWHLLCLFRRPHKFENFVNMIFHLMSSKSDPVHPRFEADGDHGFREVLLRQISSGLVPATNQAAPFLMHPLQRKKLAWLALSSVHPWQQIDSSKTRLEVASPLEGPSRESTSGHDRRPPSYFVR